MFESRVNVNKYNRLSFLASATCDGTILMFTLMCFWSDVMFSSCPSERLWVCAVVLGGVVGSSSSKSSSSTITQDDRR